MSLDESRFATLASETLERIADTVDEALGDRVDVELDSGILTMSLPGGGQYVINKHGPMKQIWMSSPVSGAWHFEHAGQGWVSTREPRAVLADQLASELKNAFGVELSF